LKGFQGRIFSFSPQTEEICCPIKLFTASRRLEFEEKILKSSNITFLLLEKERNKMRKQYDPELQSLPKSRWEILRREQRVYLTEARKYEELAAKASIKAAEIQAKMDLLKS
jgi:hypothetical protein